MRECKAFCRFVEKNIEKEKIFSVNLLHIGKECVIIFLTVNITR